jgi:hypothetical protein
MRGGSCEGLHLDCAELRASTILSTIRTDGSGTPVRATKSTCAETLRGPRRKGLGGTNSPASGSSTEREKYRLEEYELLRQLAQDDDRETVKSLELSRDSLSREDLYALREEYESSRQHLEAAFSTKIKLLAEQIEELKQ